MSGFAWHRRSKRVIATFTGFEADLLRSLTSQLVELLRNEQAAPTDSEDPLEAMMDFSGPTTEPEDPVLRRLFPTAYPDDEEAAGDFRRYTERGLSTAKVANAGAVIESLVRGGMDPDDPDADTAPVEVELDPGEVQSWLRSLTDLRLALAVRLGIETDEDAEAAAESDDEQTVVMSDIYDWLGYVQETLVRAID